MPQPVPTSLLMWIQSNENHEDIVVHIETRAGTFAPGEEIWSDHLERFGVVDRTTMTGTFVRV